MTPLMLRHLWALVERTQSYILINLDDTSLAQMLLKRYREERSLNPVECAVLSDYIYSRLNLIRDLAQQR